MESLVPRIDCCKGIQTVFSCVKEGYTSAYLLVGNPSSVLVNVRQQSTSDHSWSDHDPSKNKKKGGCRKKR